VLRHMGILGDFFRKQQNTSCKKYDSVHLQIKNGRKKMFIIAKKKYS
jgi:hypothetical protein